ncbi:TPA: hypothetical protein ACPP6V_000536 [Haemophilus influenzae]
MLSFSKKSIFISAILSCLFATFSAHASVIILGTRLIQIVIVGYIHFIMSVIHVIIGINQAVIININSLIRIVLNS